MAHTNEPWLICMCHDSRDSEDSQKQAGMRHDYILITSIWLYTNHSCPTLMDQRVTSESWLWVMAHMNESWHICMSHGTFDWVWTLMDQSVTSESWLVWISHGKYEWVTAHMNESWHIWLSHGTYEWVMAHMCHNSFLRCADVCHDYI